MSPKLKSIVLYSVFIKFLFRFYRFLFPFNITSVSLFKMIYLKKIKVVLCKCHFAKPATNILDLERPCSADEVKNKTFPNKQLFTHLLFVPKYCVKRKSRNRATLEIPESPTLYIQRTFKAFKLCCVLVILSFLRFISLLTNQKRLQKKLRLLFFGLYFRSMKLKAIFLNTFKLDHATKIITNGDTSPKSVK